MRRRLAAAVAVILPALLPAQSQWTELGPAPISNGPYTGRVSAIAASATNASLYYAAGADGGVWKTTDGGASWAPIGDFLPTTATGALALDPKDHNVLWVGTGEANFAHHSRYGLGIAKTTDGGRTWRVHGAQEFGGRCISRIRVDPKSRNVVWAATTEAGGFLPPKTAARGHPRANGPTGVFKSTDGGRTWTQLTNGIPANLSATDLVLDPSNPSVAWAAFGHIFGDARNGIYKTTNGGGRWQRLTAGLPVSGVGRVSIGIAPSRPQRLYAIFVRPSSPTSGGARTLGVYRSDDGGASWARLSAAGSFQATYGWYLSVVTVHPTDPDKVFLGGLTLRRSTNGGATFVTRTPPHVDLHALEWDAAGRLLCGDDGGVHVTANLGDRWTARNDGLGLVQFYAGISLHPASPDRIYGGFQDNGTCRRATGKRWTRVLGGDGGCTGVDPTGTRVFAEYQGTGRLFRSVNGGGFRWSGSGIFGRNCFLPPFDIDRTSALHMVYGTERVFVSTNGGSSWSPLSGDLTGGGSAAIHGIQFAPSNGSYIYVKTNDGRVQVSENGGRTWNLRRTGIPGWFRTTHPFAVDPRDPRQVYLAVGWFGTDQVLYSADAGRRWAARDGDLPDVPVHCLGIDTTQGNPPILYAGTDRGVFRTIDGGVHWEPYGRDLPYAAVIDLRVDPKHGRVVVATQGRGAWQTRLLTRAGLHAEQTK